MNQTKAMNPKKLAAGLLLGGLLLNALPAIAATFSLDAATGAPLYRSELPIEVYEYTQKDDLSDIVINNAAGERVPHVLLAKSLDHPAAAAIKSSMKLPIFALQADALKQINTSGTTSLGSDQLRLVLEKSAGKTMISINQDGQATVTPMLFLLDAGKKHEAFQKLTLDWTQTASAMIELEVLASDDLNNWSHVGRGILLKTSNDSGNLLQNVITLDPPSQSRYFQVRGVNSAQAFTLTSAEATTSTIANNPPKLLWQTLPNAKRTDDSKSGQTLIEFEANGRFPAEFLRIALPQDNTITTVKISVRNQASEPWHYLSTASAYRMVETNVNGKITTLSNPDIPIYPTVARYWQLQFNDATGGIGAASPGLSLGWPAQTMVWNARGSAPFILKIDNTASASQATIASLIPDFKQEKLTALPDAAIKLQSTDSVPASINSWDKPADYKRWWLWAGLVLGVLVLAGMALSLLKSSTASK